MATWLDVALMAINAVIWGTAAYLIGREQGMSVIVGDCP